MSETQNAKVLALLRQSGERGVTPLDALEHVGSFRLGARIFDLREAGHVIRTDTVVTGGGARVAKYVLVRDSLGVKPVRETRVQTELPWTETELRLAHGDR